MKCPLNVNVHKKEALFIGFVISFLLSFAVVISSPVGVEHPAQAIWVEPASTYLQKGEDFTVDVKINVTSPTQPGNGTGMFGFEYKLFWNQSLVNLTSYTSYIPSGWGSPNGFLVKDERGVWDSSLWDPPKHPEKDGLGYHWYGYTCFTGSPFTGDLTLATYDFTVLGQGSCELDIQDDKLVDDTATPIAHTTIDGFFSDPCPRALFAYSPEFLAVNETVTFNASASYDPDGTIASYFWSFGDGTNATGIVVNHTYSARDIYTIALTVTDDDARTDTILKALSVGGPFALFTYSPEFPLVNQTVTFNASTSFDPDGYIASYAWDFGDGNTDTGAVITHNYTAGVYNVTLTVTDNVSVPNTDTTWHIVKVGRWPIVKFTYRPKHPTVNDAVYFDASDSHDRHPPDQIGKIASYAWNFDDGTNEIYVGTNLTDIATHTYTTFGTYNVTLTVTDNETLTNSTSAIISVIDYPVADFTWWPKPPQVGETVTLNASASYDPDGGNIVRYSWDFGDDSLEVLTSDPLTNHNFTNADTYQVTLTVTDDEGITDAIGKNVTITKTGSVISISASPTAIEVGENITISGSITPTRAGATVTIYYRLGTWETLINVTTNSAGEYSYIWTPEGAGTYEVDAGWLGDVITLGAESSIITLTVEKVAPTDYLLYAMIAVLTVISVALAIYARVRLPWLARAFFQQRAMLLLLIVTLVVGVGVTGYVNRPREEPLPPSPPPPPTPGAPGELPTWAVGDSWLFTDVVNDTAYYLNQTAVGEATIDGTDCYEVTLVWSPDTPRGAALGLHNDMKMWFDKASLRAVKLNATGEVLSFPYVYTLTYSYEIEMINGTAPWSRVVVNEWKRNTTTTQIVLVGGSPVEDLCKTYWNVTWIKVEALENVTVPAGTFECFRIATYNETGEGLLSVSWHSDEVRTSVKSIDYDAPGFKSSQYDPDTRELERPPEFPA